MWAVRMHKRKYKAEPRFQDDRHPERHPLWCVKDPRGERISLTYGPNAQRNAKRIAKALSGT